jgi:hypothetical protein
MSPSTVISTFFMLILPFLSTDYGPNVRHSQGTAKAGAAKTGALASLTPGKRSAKEEVLADPLDRNRIVRKPHDGRGSEFIWEKESCQ